MALFTEMYGVPLTIYLLWGWLARRVEGLDLSHETGHLWQALLGWKGDPHLSPIHLVSGVLIGGGFVLLTRAWAALHAAQREHRLATTGPYRWPRLDTRLARSALAGSRWAQAVAARCPHGQGGSTPR